MANLITNPSFETDTTGWDGASSFFTNSGATLTRITTDSHLGSACCKVDVTNASNQQGATIRNFTLAANTTYVAYAWVKWISGRQVRLRLRDFANSAFYDTSFTSSSSWTKISVTFTTGGTGGTTNNILSVCTDTTAATSQFYLDEVMLSPVTEASAGAVTATVTTNAPTKTDVKAKGLSTVSVTGTAFNAFPKNVFPDTDSASVATNQPKAALGGKAQSLSASATSNSPKSSLGVKAEGIGI